jgi:hypothetical protein
VAAILREQLVGFGYLDVLAVETLIKFYRWSLPAVFAELRVTGVSDEG